MLYGIGKTVRLKVVVWLAAGCTLAGSSLAQEEAGESTFVVTKIAVDGNKYYNDNYLRDLLGIEKGQPYERYLFDYMLERGLEAVKEAYRGEGFEEAVVRWGFRDVRDGKRKLELRIEEGPREVIADILLEGVSREHYLAVRESLGLDVGSPLSARDLNEAALKIGRYYGDRGYVYASATLEINRETGVVVFKVEEGDVYHIGEIIVAGNERTRPKIITREIEYKIKPDRLWRASKIDESRANIYRTGLYRDLRVEPADSKRDPTLVDVFVLVREDKFRWYKLEPGYESPDRAAFTVGWGHNNIFGNNQRLSTEASVKYGFAAEYSEFRTEATYVEPWLFSFRYRGAATLYFERDSQESKRHWEVGLEPRVTREITEYLEVTGGMNVKRAYTEFGPRGDDVTVIWPVSRLTERYLGLAGPQNITSFIFSSTVNTRDDIFNPLQGLYLFGSEETAGGPLWGEDFWRVIADGRQYIRVAPAATVAGRLRGGYASAYGHTKDVPFAAKFFSGGAYSVRGYGERGLGPQADDGFALGGNISFTGNIEFRFQLPFTAGRRVPGIGLNLGNFWAGMFADGGNVWADWDELRKTRHANQTLKYGAGFGLRYNTPVGPIRFDYGRPIMTREVDRPGNFYFAFGHAF
ncbi:MAG: BamA/TamA family outer membrane protein [Candidatus Coatesbacteria bacterium]|nr:MAG: BamA/TamA family outer membrane protein [Candidatus Coatesbacteria bacterium]